MVLRVAATSLIVYVRTNAHMKGTVMSNDEIRDTIKSRLTTMKHGEPTKITLTFADIDAFIRAMPEAERHDVIGYDPDDDTHIFREAVDQTSFATYYRAFAGFDTITTPDTITFNPMMFHVVEATVTLITNEYDWTDTPDHTRDPDVIRLWDVFELGGDDDVDYSGSYIAGAIDILRKWCDANGVKHD
jgi:hypothetical protein